MVEPQIKILQQKKLIGIGLEMTFAANRTHELWKNFMPRRNEIRNAIGSCMYSMQLYDPAFDFRNFNPHATFKKWAALEVNDFGNIPDGMESILLPGGSYAVFMYRGDPTKAEATFRYIFGVWMPASVYEVDNSRPHFEVLGEKYKNNSPDSEEEIWVPVKLKNPAQ